MAPVVSIIVTCFNQERYLEKSVKSVLSQTFTDLECLIVDDGSSDRTREVAEHLMTIDSRVKYFYKENGGVSSARNFGFRQAQGEWIQFLDADDWIDQNKTSFQLSNLNGLDGKNTVFYCDYERVFLDKEQNITDRQLNIVGSLTKDQLIQRLLIPDFLADSPFPVLQQCMLMNRSIFSKKMFDESLKALQDRDFPLGLLQAGVNFVYTPIVGAFYTKHQTNRTNKWSYMKGYYILLYETVYSKQKDLLPLCEIGIDFLVQETIREKDKANFERLIKIIDSPVYFLDKKVKVNNPAFLKIIYSLRQITPSFILYEKYRGPRSQKILSIFSKLTGKKNKEVI
ncbi:glycosyltransferase family 2 protein [Argonema galeatum]|uniref:glycosyltransferase family 2 protein n=1 Tax=Argonema galeatum TaxID=2942762 RepID=UPI0020126550|nr:glycosyltransferase family 2 protein [Argonema galeatum]MCL1466740.1 glycosyltransferase [Argonema galeatum A003/A1]